MPTASEVIAACELPAKPPKGTVRIWVTVVDGAPGGPAGDGTWVRRFHTFDEAHALARRSTCWGQPATVTAQDAPKRIADRWGF